MVGGSPASSTTKTGRHDIAESGIKNNKIKSIKNIWSGGVRVWQSCFVLVGFVLGNLLFCFGGVRVAKSLVFCVMVGRLLVGFVCLNL